MRDVFGVCDNLKVFKSVICLDAILMVDLKPFWDRTNECLVNEAVGFSNEASLPGAAKRIVAIALYKLRFKQQSWFRPLRTRDALNISINGDLVSPLKAGDWPPCWLIIFANHEREGAA